MRWKNSSTMDRELPIHTIEGTVFIVDVNKNELCQLDNQENRIRFEDMDYTGVSYRLEYDLEQKNIPYSPDANPVKDIIVPPLISLDPEGMAFKYGLPISVIQQKSDFDILVNPKLLTKRMNGELPVVDIAGHDYLVDYHSSELRAKDNSNTVIQLHNLDYHYQDEMYRGFYQISTRRILDIDEATIQEIPKDLVMLEIPFERKLDPYAFAIEEKLDIKSTVIKYPPEEKRVINIVPIEQTNLPKLVKINREWAKRVETKKQQPIKKMRRGPKL